MIKRTVVCDRCGEECIDGTYYTLGIYSYDANPTNNSKGRFDIQTYQRQYCKKCKDEIVAFSLKKEINDEDKCVNCRQAIDCINGLLDECVYKG